MFNPSAVITTTLTLWANLWGTIFWEKVTGPHIVLFFPQIIQKGHMMLVNKCLFLRKLELEVEHCCCCCSVFKCRSLLKSINKRERSPLLLTCGTIQSWAVNFWSYLKDTSQNCLWEITLRSHWFETLVDNSENSPIKIEKWDFSSFIQFLFFT